MQLNYFDHLKQNGFLLFSQQESPFTLEEWEALKNAVSPKNKPYVEKRISTTGKNGYVDVYHAKLQEEDYRCEEVKKIIGGEKFAHFLSTICDGRSVEPSRVQSHIYPVDGYISKHIDSELESYFICSCVMSLSNAYEGGEFILYHPNGTTINLRLPKYTLLITPSNYMHEVKPVTKGARHTVLSFVRNLDTRAH